MKIEYFISDKQVSTSCVNFLKPNSSFYDINCKGMLYEDCLLIKLHKLPKRFDSFVKHLCYIIVHEIFHIESRSEVRKYKLGEDIAIYKAVENLSDDEISGRIALKLLYKVGNVK